MISIQKSLITSLAVTAVLYGLAVLWFVSTQQTVPIGCLLTNEVNGPGIEIRDVSLLDTCKGHTPEVGDRIIQLAGHHIHSFTDWVRVHRKLRNYHIDSGAIIQMGDDPSEKNGGAEIFVVEYPDKSRYVQMWFLRAGDDQPLQAWLPLSPQPIFTVSLSLVWFVLQLFVVVIGGLAFWNRSFDQPVRTFFALSAVTLVAFIGGSHWWVIAASPFLVILFAAAGVFLPALLLHFFLVHPTPVPAYRYHRTTVLISLYLIPILSLFLICGIIAVNWILTTDFGVGPFASTIERMGSLLAASLLPILKSSVFSFFAIGLVYFICSLVALNWSMKYARSQLELNQLRTIYWAAMFAVVPLVYTIYLAAFHRVDFALGAARIPMYLASLAFMLAYGIGIAKYKLLLIDQVVSRGVWYYTCTIGVLLIFSALIAVGAVNILHQDLGMFRHTIPLVLVLMTSVLILSWARDAIQNTLDQRFFSEKYQLDKALNRMNRVVSSMMEPEAVSDSLLNSCREVLQVSQAALYLRVKNGSNFRMSTSAGRGNFPLQITVVPEYFELLESQSVLQRVPQSSSPAQLLIRELRAEVVHGLEIQDQLAGILVLGAKPNNSPYSAEDVAFVNSMARVTAVALQCAKVQQDVGRLNQEVQLKLERIEDQDRQLTALHKELAELTRSPVTLASESSFKRMGIKGESPAILQVLDTVRKVAITDASVLVRGESGTGKELLAQSVHANSSRANGPMVSVHCAALSASLLESELFGHVKGAFTDAREDKLGRFAMADGGTLFLDEIGDISQDVQVKLLRVLQERVFEPVGGTKSIKVNVRIVAATHRNLEQLIADGKFREDLFYRLNVISITLPPLRERREDLFELTNHFLRVAAEKSSKQVRRIDDKALKLIDQYDWPGNIRELNNVIERAVVMSEGTSIRFEDLPVEIRESNSESRVRLKPSDTAFAATRTPRQISFQAKPTFSNDTEQTRLVNALKSCNGNKAEAARMLNMPRSTFFSKLKKYKIK